MKKKQIQKNNVYCIVMQARLGPDISPM